MFNLITRFHLLELTILVAITAVAVLRVPVEFAYPAHWGGGQPDWLWPRNWALAGGPVVALTITLVFGVLGVTLTKNRLLQSKHILEPALTLLLGVIVAVQMGLLLQGVGSDLDLIRLIGFGLGAILVVLGVVLAEAERNSYAGLRMPWPVPGDDAWRTVHRTAGGAFALAGLGLAFLAWRSADLAVLLQAIAAALLLPVAIAAIATTLVRISRRA